MAQFTYNEKKKFVADVDNLLNKNKSFADALKIVSYKQDVNPETLRKYYGEKMKILKAVDNGWGKETKLTNEKLRTRNKTTVRKRATSDTQFRQSDKERMIKIRKFGDYLEADIIERSNRLQSSPNQKAFSHKASNNYAKSCRNTDYGKGGSMEKQPVSPWGGSKLVYLLSGSNHKQVTNSSSDSESSYYSD